MLKNITVSYHFCEFVATKKGKTANFSPLLFRCCCGIRDQGSGMEKKLGSKINIRLVVPDLETSVVGNIAK
jgi:hypothetical protein